MTLWIVRHARAVDRSLSLRDARRPLTPEGRERFAEAARGLRRLGARFDLVLHSPLLRAVETADLLTPLLRGESSETAVTPALAGPPRAALLAEVRASGTDSVAVVGHEPWL